MCFTASQDDDNSLKIGRPGSPDSNLVFGAIVTSTEPTPILIGIITNTFVHFLNLSS
jgi:hypothetical protein